MPARFLAIGHVTRDEFPGEAGWRLGGTVTYAAATASRLGAHAALVTRVGPHERAALVERCAAFGCELVALPALVTTTFVFREEAGRRVLRLSRRARGLRLADVPDALRGAEAVVLGSVAHEIDRSLPGAFAGAATVVTAQGYLREWDAAGVIHPRRWEDGPAVAATVSAIVLSDEDVAGDLVEPRRWAAAGPVIVTRADRGALVLANGAERMVQAFPAERVVDPTGAGDAFAAALALALAERQPLLDAVRFASATASFAVEGPGTDGLADRDRVLARMEQGRASGAGREDEA